MDAGAASPYERADPEVLVWCRDLRALQIALALITFREDFGDLDDWEDGIRSTLATLAPTP